MCLQAVHKARGLLGGATGCYSPCTAHPQLSTKTQASSGSDAFSPSESIQACLCLLAQGTRRVARGGIRSFWSSSKVCFLIRVLVT